MEGQLSKELVGKIGAVFQWEITDGRKVVATWTTDLKTGEGRLYKGAATPARADCTLKLSDDDLAALVDGKLNAMNAYFAGKLKVSGNLMLAQKLGSILKGLGTKGATSPKAVAQAPPAAAPKATNLKVLPLSAFLWSP